MNNRLLDHLYFLFTISLTSYGLLIIKWRIAKVGVLPQEMILKLRFLLQMFLYPLVLSGYIAAFLAGLAWMAAMTKFDLSYAYPFMSFNFVAVLLLSGIFLGESITLTKVTVGKSLFRNTVLE